MGAIPPCHHECRVDARTPRWRHTLTYTTPLAWQNTHNTLQRYTATSLNIHVYIYIYIVITPPSASCECRHRPWAAHTRLAPDTAFICDWVRFLRLGAAPSTYGAFRRPRTPCEAGARRRRLWKERGVGTFRLVGKTRVFVFGFRAHRVSENPAAPRKNIDLACVLCFPDFLSKHDFRT